MDHELSCEWNGWGSDGIKIKMFNERNLDTS